MREDFYAYLRGSPPVLGSSFAETPLWTQKRDRIYYLDTRFLIIMTDHDHPKKSRQFTTDDGGHMLLVFAHESLAGFGSDSCQKYRSVQTTTFRRSVSCIHEQTENTWYDVCYQHEQSWSPICQEARMYCFFSLIIVLYLLTHLLSSSTPDR